MDIPFVDLKAQYYAHRPEIDEAIRDVIESSSFIGGEFVTSFGSAFAKACGVKHCVTVANGTDAIYIVLKMLGVGPGDEVITVANSWISTSEAITQAGGRPVFVDVDQYHNIDVSRIEEMISARTKAIIPVHLYGQPAAMDKIVEICERHRLLLVEDCAQAHFAELKGRKVGTFGRAGTFSFYPGKNLGAYGDAGAIVTNDSELAEKMRMYANHGALVKHEHLMEGINSRLDSLQAAILSAKLPHVADWNAARRKVAAKYQELLSGIDGVSLPKVMPGATHVFHLYVIRARERNRLKSFLQEKGIQTAIHYPTALPLMKAYDYLGHKPEHFPMAAKFQSEILSLPIFPEMTDEQLVYVADMLREFYRRS